MLRILILAFLVSAPTISWGDYTFTAADAEGRAGETALVSVQLDSDEPIRGYSFGLTHDAVLLSVVDALPGDATVDLNDGDGVDYFFFDSDPLGGTGLTVGCVFSLDLPIEELPAGDAQEIAVIEYEVSGTAEVGDTSDLVFSSELGSPPVALVVSEAGFSVAPEVVAGSVTVPDPVFLRGDADVDGFVSGLADSVFLLQVTFDQAFTGEILCADAADVDGNGINSALLDSLVLLQWRFAGGDPPPAPGTEVCGPDEDDTDDLGCDTPPICD